MSVNTIIFPNGGNDILNCKDIHIGDLIINDNLVAPQTITTTGLYNAVTGGGSGGLPSDMTPQEILIASSGTTVDTADNVGGVASLSIPLKISSNARGFVFEVNASSGDTLFEINNSHEIKIGDGFALIPRLSVLNNANNDIFMVDGGNNIVSTLNTILDDGTGRSSFNELNIKPFNDNSNVFSVKNAIGSSNFINVDTSSNTLSLCENEGQILIGAITTVITPFGDYANTFRVNLNDGTQVFNINTSLAIAEVEIDGKFDIKNSISGLAGITSGTGTINLSTLSPSSNIVISSGYTNTTNGAVCFDVVGVPSGAGNVAVNFSTAGGSSFVSSSGTFVPVSDGRLKKNINDSILGYQFIDALKPKTYLMKNDEEDSNIIHGFIAQDIEEMCNDKDFKFGGVIKQGNGQYNLSYQDLIPILVKNLQQLNHDNRLMAKKIDKLNELYGDSKK